MSKNKISLSFVNDGKKFEIPRFTVARQEEMLEKARELEKKDKDIDLNKALERQMLLSTLQDIDSSVKMEDIQNMHPSDYVYLSELIFNEGRELTESDAGNFQKKKKK